MCERLVYKARLPQGILLPSPQGLSTKNNSNDAPSPCIFIDEIWPVVIKDKGIAPMQNLVGSFHLAKVNRCLRILKENSKEVVQEFLLANIKRSGYSGSVLLLEIGRSHPLGPGDIWFEVADSAIAEKMHHIIFG